MRRATAVLLLAGTLAGCTSHSVNESPWLVRKDMSAPKSCEPLTADQELVLGLSGEMAGAGRRHAALANLERLPDEIPQVRLSKARLLRLLGHGSEAETLYTSLLGSCLMADANHGLGQIEAGRGNYAEAQRYLRMATSLAPAKESIRNDLGVVYMNQGRLSEARFELLTAMELEENSRRAAQNMLTLLVYEGNWQAARELVNAKGLSSADFNRAEQRARRLHGQGAKAPTSAPAQPPLATPVPAGTAAAVASLAAPAAPSARPVATVPTAAPAPARAPATAPAPTPIRAFAAPQSQATATTDSATARAATPIPLSAAVRAWAAEDAASVDSATPKPAVQPAPAARARPLVCRSTESSGSRLAVMECLPE